MDVEFEEWRDEDEDENMFEAEQKSIPVKVRMVFLNHQHPMLKLLVSAEFFVPRSKTCVV